MFAMRDGQNTALAEHDVEIEVLGQALPQLERMLIDSRAFIPQIIGPDYGGVTAGIAAAEPAFFKHRDIGHAVNSRHVIRCRQTMTAAADDDRIVFGLGFRRTPCPLPVLVVRAGVAGQRKNGIFGFAAW